jgi:hypothetical protein
MGTEMKVSQLKGAELDYWVGKAEGIEGVQFGIHDGRCGYYDGTVLKIYSPSASWGIGGPIIARERISIEYEWDAMTGEKRWHAHGPLWTKIDDQGRTPLEAAMRQYVSSKFGRRLPEE